MNASSMTFCSSGSARVFVADEGRFELRDMAAVAAPARVLVAGPARRTLFGLPLDALQGAVDGLAPLRLGRWCREDVTGRPERRENQCLDQLRLGFFFRIGE